MFQIYTGNGKGKTTAAVGLAARALGNGMRVRFIQFLKRGGCGEHIAMAKLGLEIDSGYEVSAPPWNKEAQDEWREHAKVQWKKAIDTLGGGYDVIVLDELLGAMAKGFVPLGEVLEYLEKVGDAELIVTGRNPPEELIVKADLISRIEPVKHYIDAGVVARKGIEF